jgi:hypothetical protein
MVPDAIRFFSCQLLYLSLLIYLETNNLKICYNYMYVRSLEIQINTSYSLHCHKKTVVKKLLSVLSLLCGWLKVLNLLRRGCENKRAVHKAHMYLECYSVCPLVRIGTP